MIKSIIECEKDFKCCSLEGTPAVMLFIQENPKPMPDTNTYPATASVPTYGPTKAYSQIALGLHQ